MCIFFPVKILSPMPILSTQITVSKQLISWPSEEHKNTMALTVHWLPDGITRTFCSLKPFFTSGYPNLWQAAYGGKYPLPIKFTFHVFKCPIQNRSTISYHLLCICYNAKHAFFNVNNNNLKFTSDISSFQCIHSFTLTTHLLLFLDCLQILNCCCTCVRSLKRPDAALLSQLTCTFFLVTTT